MNVREIVKYAHHFALGVEKSASYPLFLYEWHCGRCEKSHDVFRHHSQSGEPYACPDCGSSCERLYTAAVQKEFFEFRGKGGERIGSRRQDKRYLKKNGRVLTQDTSGWSDIRRMAKDGQRRTLLAQKGHY